MIYLWRNDDTGETVEHDHPQQPPHRDGIWHRVFKVGIGRITDAGDSPSRPSGAN